MVQKTLLAQDIDSADARAHLDNVCKKLLAHKIILAWIMKHTMDEYQNYSIQEIAEQYIEGLPQVFISSFQSDSSIHGDTTEDTSISEGTILYDIRFRAIVPQNGTYITLIINVEAQNNFYPGYPLIKRSLYYCCRMICYVQL